MREVLGRVFGDTANPAGAMWDLQKKLGAPTNLRTVGFALDQLDAVAQHIYERAQTVGYNNPRPVVAADIAEMLSRAASLRQLGIARTQLLPESFEPINDLDEAPREDAARWGEPGCQLSGSSSTLENLPR